MCAALKVQAFRAVYGLGTILGLWGFRVKVLGALYHRGPYGGRGRGGRGP